VIAKDVAEIIKAIQSFVGMNSYEVFSDFVELAALSTMQAFEITRQKELAEQISRFQKKYKPKEIERLGNMLGMLVMAMEKYHKQGRYVDILARVFIHACPYCHRYVKREKGIKICLCCYGAVDNDRAINYRGRVNFDGGQSWRV
jgi:hypothetical protein